VHVLYSFPDGIGRPGIGTTAFQQVKEVARHGVDVTLYCTSLHRELPKNVRVVETLSIVGKRIPHRVPGVERAYRYHDARVARALEKYASGVDLVHCWPRAAIRTCVTSRRRGIPSLREVPNTHTAHAFEVVARENVELGLEPARGHSHTYDAAALAREELEYEVADALLVPSDYAYTTFVERGIATEKLVLHRYGYDPARFAPASRARGDRRLTALYAGRCEPRKGLHHALRAWLDSGLAATGRFVVCGSFEPSYRALLEPMLSHPSVELHGFVSDPSALMRSSDVLVFPSIEEGSALVVYEAQACGCVPIVSEAAGARCRHGIDGLVHRPGDVATLTAHLRRIGDDPELLRRLRGATLEAARNLTWESAAAELVQIYAQRSAGERRRRTADVALGIG
jgi:glycosyltransferase involved in cell wall biosynthesis